MRVCSLFSGIGGIDIAFQKAGFDIVWANEYDKYACSTYRSNFNSVNLLEEDIRKVDAKTIPDFDVLTAGFPCQSFSIAGKQRGFNDARGELFFQVVRIAQVKKPQVIFLENVSNLLDHDEGKSFLKIYNSLVPLGYTFKYCIMNSAEYGNVPQSRERVFIVGFMDDMLCSCFQFPGKIKLTRKINDIIDRSKKHSQVYYYDNSNPYFNELLSLVKDTQAVYRIYDWGIAQKAFYICPTLTSYMEICPERIPIIIDNFGIRKLTPYECLYLQGFPDNFKFAPGTPLPKAYRQVGNSVCVPVIRRIAEQIKKVME